MDTFMQWVVDNQAAIAQIVVEIIALVAVTKWGLAHKTALGRVTQGVEMFAKKTGDKSVKLEVAKVTSGAPAAVAEALTAAISRAEDDVHGVSNKVADKPAVVIVKALTRAIPLAARLLLKPMLLVGVGVGLMAGCATTGADGTQRPTITPQQQAQVNRFISALVAGGIQYYEAKEAVEVERHAYEDAKKTAVQAGGVAAVTAWGAERGGKTKAEALHDGRLAAEAWCITKGTTLAEVMAVVAKGAPAKVDAGDIFEGILAEQLRYIADADPAQ